MACQPVLGLPPLGPGAVDGDPPQPPLLLAGEDAEPPSGTTVVDVGESGPVAVVDPVDEVVALCVDWSPGAAPGPGTPRGPCGGHGGCPAQACGGSRRPRGP